MRRKLVLHIANKQAGQLLLGVSYWMAVDTLVVVRMGLFMMAHSRAFWKSNALFLHG